MRSLLERPKAMLDIAGIIIAFLFAWCAAHGPEEAVAKRWVDGPIRTVATVDAQDGQGLDREVRFKLADAEIDLSYALAQTHGPMIRLALQRGDAASAGLDAQGVIVMLAVDGQQILTERDTAAARRASWVGSLLCLMILLAGFVILRPAQAARVEVPRRSS